MIRLAPAFVFCAVGMATTSAFAAEDNDRIQRAVDVVKGLCLAGKEYDIQADAGGNVTIKSFKPGATGRLSVNVKEADGAVVLRDELRIIGDADIRACTAKHIERIIDAVLEVSPPPRTSTTASHDSVRTAKYVGALPGVLTFTDFAEGRRELYYRFSVSSPIYFKASGARFANSINFYLGTEKANIAKKALSRDGVAISDIFLTSGDYYLVIRASDSGRATPYQAVIEGVEAD